MKKRNIIFISITLLTSLLSFFVNQKATKVRADEVCELDSKGIITRYESVYSALNVASQMGGTVKLLNDLSEDIWLNNITINSDIDVTFDLNGHKYNEKVVDEQYKRIILNGTFTLKDSSITKTGQWNYLKNENDEFNNKIKLSQDSQNIKLNIEGGYISNFASFVDAYSSKNSTISVSGGVFDEPLFNSITNNVNFNVSGGTFNYDPVSIQISKNGILNVDLSNNIDGFSLYCTQTNLLNKKMNISISDDLLINNRKITMQIVHNVNTDLDGVIVATFLNNVINKDASCFELKLLDTTTSIVKETEVNWKLVVIGNNLVLKPKSFNETVIPDVSNKLIIKDNDGNKLTFTNKYNGDLTPIENCILSVNNINETQKHRDLVSKINYKNYSIVQINKFELIKDLLKQDVTFDDKFYVSIKLNDDVAIYDNYIVVDHNGKVITPTLMDGIISFETQELKEYIILAKNVNKTSYLLEAIIPLSIILIGEIIFLSLYYFKKKKSKKMMSVFVFNALWAGAIPLIICESILIVLLGAYIVYLLIHDKKRK